MIDALAEPVQSTTHYCTDETTLSWLQLAQEATGFCRVLTPRVLVSVGLKIAMPLSSQNVSNGHPYRLVDRV